MLEAVGFFPPVSPHSWKGGLGPSYSLHLRLFLSFLLDSQNARGELADE